MRRLVSGGSMAHEVADRVYRLGADLVNWWIVEDGGKVTVVDTGTPKQHAQLPIALDRLGMTLADVDAIVLTHAHGDHAGSAARVKNESQADVHVHHQDVALARGEAKREYERHFVRELGHRFVWKSLWFFARSGINQVIPIQDLSEFGHEEVLDIPGRPRVIHTPGHTDGSSCIEFADRKVLMTGDSLVTLNLVTGERSPRILPGSFNKNSPEALESLNELRGSGAEVILPGHGEPWHGSVDAAVALAHRTGAS